MSARNRQPSAADDDPPAPDERVNDEEPDDPFADDPFDDTQEVDLDLADVDVGDPVSGEPAEDDDDPFDGTEGVDPGFSDTVQEEGYDGVGESFEDSLGPGDDDTSTAVAENINAGAARLAVLGLQDEFEVNGGRQTKKDLETEFEEVFETFRLGHYGAECAHEYLLIEDENIEPIWGFLASAMLCTAMCMWMRPDGDELVSNVTDRMTIPKP